MSQESGKKGFDRRGFLRASAGVVAVPAVPVGALAEVASVASSVLTPAAKGILRKFSTPESGGVNRLLDIFSKLLKSSSDFYRNIEKHEINRTTSYSLFGEEIAKQRILLERTNSLLSSLEGIISTIGDVPLVDVNSLLSAQVHEGVGLFSNAEKIIESLKSLESQYNFPDSATLSEVYKEIAKSTLAKLLGSLVEPRDLFVQTFEKGKWVDVASNPKDLKFEGFKEWKDAVLSNIYSLSKCKDYFTRADGIIITPLSTFYQKAAKFADAEMNLGRLRNYIDDFTKYLSAVHADSSFDPFKEVEIENNYDNFKYLANQTENLWSSIEGKDSYEDHFLPEFTDESSTRSSYIQPTYAALYGGIMFSESGSHIIESEKGVVVSRIKEFIKDRIKATNRRLKREGKLEIVVTENDYSILVEHGSIVVTFNNPFMNDINFGDFKKLTLKPTKQEHKEVKKDLKEDMSALKAQLDDHLEKLYKISQQYTKEAILDRARNS